MLQDSRQPLSVAEVPITSLKAHPNNARTHSKHQIRQIANSIRMFGFTNPVLINQDSMIMAGHARVAAAELIGMDKVPTIRIEHLSLDQIRAYVLADNRLAESSRWDKSILAIELQHLTISSEIPDITLTGFQVGEIDLIIQSANNDKDGDDELDFQTSAAPVTQLGDLWQLGRHRVVCGNSLEDDSYKRLFTSSHASAAFADSPYNVPVNGHVSGNGRIRHKEFAMASGEMTKTEFNQFLRKSMELMSKYSSAGAVHYICMDWRSQSELLLAGEAVYDELLNVCVWVKNVGGMGSFYRSQHELIYVYRLERQWPAPPIQSGGDDQDPATRSRGQP